MAFIRRRYLTPSGMGADSIQNRLLLIPPRAIAVRIYGLAKPGSRPDAAWNAEYAATLQAIRSTGASQEEFRDLSLVDGLFGGGVPVFGPRPDNSVIIPKLATFISGITPAEAVGMIKKRAYDTALATARVMVQEPLFSVPPLRIPLVAHSNYQQMLSVTTPMGFKLNQDLPWGQIRQATWNAANVALGMENYPWPKMLGTKADVSHMWWLLEFSNVLAMIHSGAPKSPEDIRLYATMTLLSRAEEIAARTMSMVEERARHAAQFEKTKMIAMAASALVMSAVGGVVLAGAVGPTIGTMAGGILKAGMNLGMKAISAQDAVASQKAMTELQMSMQSDDPAFASEMQSGIDFLDNQISQLASQPPLETVPPPPVVDAPPAVTPQVQPPAVTDSTSQPDILGPTTSWNDFILTDPFPYKAAVQPSTGGAITDEEYKARASQVTQTTPADRYDVMVEGANIGTVASLEQAASLAISRSGTGDRSWITKNGVRIGMGIMTPGGFVSVPSDKVDAVMAMSHEEIVAGVTSAAQTAAAETGTPDPTKKISGWWALLALPVAAYAVMKGS